MGNFIQYTVFESKGFDDYKSWLQVDKSKYVKTNSLITSIQREGPLIGLDKPEALKGNFIRE